MTPTGFVPITHGELTERQADQQQADAMRAENMRSINGEADIPEWQGMKL